MHGLTKGITQLANYETNQTVRKNAVNLLNGVIEDMNSGIDVWNDFLEKGATKAESGAYGGWAEFSIEKQLFDIELSARDKAKMASNGQSSLDDPLIALAYNKLLDDQTPSDACQHAITEMEDRIGQIRTLIDLINNVKPKKPAETKNKASSQKPVTKKTVNRQTTKAKAASAKKKAVTKKSAKKKPAVKKKPTVKKTAKKKVATKKGNPKSKAKKHK